MSRSAKLVATGCSFVVRLIDALLRLQFCLDKPRIWETLKEFPGITVDPSLWESLPKTNPDHIFAELETDDPPVARFLIETRVIYRTD